VSEERLEAEFYEELGRALVAWQQIETNLWFVFSTAIGASAGSTSMKAYYAIPSFSNQWKMTDAVVREEIENPLSNRIANADVMLTEWSEIRKALFDGEDAAYPRRNHIAHHVWRVATVDEGSGIRGQAHPATKNLKETRKASVLTNSDPCADASTIRLLV